MNRLTTVVPRTFHRNLEQISLCCSPFCLLQIILDIWGNSWEFVTFEVWNMLQAFYYHALFWRGIPNCLSIAWIQILTFSSKNSLMSWGMTILIFIPVVCWVNTCHYRFIQNIQYVECKLWVTQPWRQLSVNWFWGQCSRDIWVISCAEIHGETPFCVPWRKLWKIWERSQTLGISLDKCHQMPQFVIFCYHPHTKNSESEHLTLLRFPVPN